MNDQDKQPQDLFTSHVVSVTIAGRPNRDTVIDNDDISNLKIALHTTNNVTNFLKIIA